MTRAEEGFLLLTSHMGDPNRRVLSASQLRILSTRVQTAKKCDDERDLNMQDLLAMGYGRLTAEQILRLLDERQLLQLYCKKGQRQNCLPLPRIAAAYPRRLWQALGEETVGCLWYKGDIELLTQPAVALVGSRDIREENRLFAQELGRQTALQGYVLVSGNARGADKAAQQACLAAGGRVVSVIADSLAEKEKNENILYLSEDEYDAPFSAQRAISRNRIIHSLARVTFVAQCADHTGGTWDGTVKNLRHGWSLVCCFDDGSNVVYRLEQMGARCVTMHELSDIGSIRGEISLFE